MRVTLEQIKIFDELAHRYFGKDAGLWLFGSRVDDNKRGGDYDFLVETTLLDADEIIGRKIALLADLQDSEPFADEKIVSTLNFRAEPKSNLQGLSF
jgi:predicted nucleotidyltransferase